MVDGCVGLGSVVVGKPKRALRASRAEGSAVGFAAVTGAFFTGGLRGSTKGIPKRAARCLLFSISGSKGPPAVAAGVSASGVVCEGVVIGGSTTGFGVGSADSTVVEDC